ncbi:MULTISPECIES: 5-formyltetrahydrofolate cyclo-ligase [Brenneria]|uniref:5-formyltetrahydrofolate cyclo-ligase n=1 Tax=Brenneria nigrifluens DSM 30175 = ATCC 13028 TaxID=1121120 RepID=A0A2U1UPI6_9GAMM|nr:MULTISPECIES: 5-formyltetrahydrofolate cyclo-ligase [Brenneria]EHD23297.1 5-formyltetrahydrofolate cyclo-ligase [Brenneria sp. EniD312]PWC23511.1 5-formyltetrahydrofolate cyclo-ligase [Brenneria nigrifluens DSM 30175 = ATCC 13028]QCR06229.1 5-formyltetrahydrofolate cyclo-ligase [Brenneria nigrifluens DSM 30175 = ATCC 13028]
MQPIPSSTAPLSSAQLRRQIRRDVRQRRRQLSAEQQALFAQQALARALTHRKIEQADSIAVFLSFDGELDTQPLIQQFWQRGKRVYLPALHPFSAGNLLFLRYEPDSELVLNRLKILEPRLDVRRVLPLQRLDVLLTPLVAFDRQGQRLGMGGGFYDRTLRHWPRGGPYPIGLAHDCQQVDRLPVESWDIPLPEIITPSRCWRW